MDKLLIIGIIVGLLAVAGLAVVTFGSPGITGKVISPAVTAAPQQAQPASAPAAVANPIASLPDMVGGC